MEPRFYTYFSKSKIDMLFPQIPRSLLDGIAGELKIDLGFLSTSFKDSSGGDQSWDSKIRIIEKHLKKLSIVGTFNDPNKYIFGCEELRWGFYGDRSDLVYFSGQVGGVFFGMGGSASNVVGNNRKSSETMGPVSTTAFLVEFLCKELELPGLSEYQLSNMAPLRIRGEQNLALMAVEHACKFTKGPRQKFEFLAKRLISSKDNSVILATPLYVAMND